VFSNKKDYKTLAELWKKEKLAELKAEAQVLEILLRTTRDQIAELSSLEGEELAGVFGWQSPEEVEKLFSAAKIFGEEIAKQSSQLIAAQMVVDGKKDQRKKKK
jgi:hypothetical protein